jgi:hypothetical protein
MAILQTSFDLAMTTFRVNTRHMNIAIRLGIFRMTEI